MHRKPVHSVRTTWLQFLVVLTLGVCTWRLHAINCDLLVHPCNVGDICPIPQVPYCDLPNRPDPVPPPDDAPPGCNGMCSITPPGYEPPGCEPNGDACNGLHCGSGTPPWAKPLPGGGGPPPSYCSGADCVNPGNPAPPRGGGDQPPGCMGMGCGGQPAAPGSQSPFNSPNWSFPGPGGNPAAPDRTLNPVNQAVGLKHESDVDLHVPLQGRDFRLARSYLGKAGLRTGWSGNNWQLNISYFLMRYDRQGVTDKVLAVSALSTGQLNFERDTSTSTRWDPTGSHSQYIEAATLAVDIGEGTGKTYPVYKLVTPGQWTAYFGRVGTGGNQTIVDGTWKDGTIFQVSDTYGNVRTFKYKDNDNSVSTVMRLDEIHCIPAGGGTNDGAKIVFDWYAADHSTTELQNMLERVRVRRYIYNGSAWVWDDVQKVEYTYKTGDTSDALGTKRDLVQVTKLTKVDHGQWHTIITQYRYHTNQSESTDTPPSGDGDGFLESGSATQLKAVFLPEQIEYAAEQFNETANPKKTLAEFAEYLRAGGSGGAPLGDGAAAYGSTKVMQLASKVINQYETTGEKRVKEQHLQSACGCSGSGHATKLTYTYINYTSNDYSRTVAVTESTRDPEDDDSYIVQRTHYYDSKQYTITTHTESFPMEFVVNDVVQEGTSGDTWATVYEYDTNTPRRVKKIFTPAAVSSYVPGSGPSDTVNPTATTNNMGLIYEFAYNSDNRITDTYVNQGTSTYATYPVSRNYWHTDSGKEWLLTKIEYFRTPESSPTTDQTKIQTTEFNYQFYSGSVAPKWVETVIEAELQAENGPDASGTKYYSHEYFDAYGRNLWSRRQDGALVQRTFDVDTGALKTIIENAAPSGPMLTETLSCCSLSGLNSDGDELETIYEYDDLGRLRSITSPSGVVTRFVRELVIPGDLPGLGLERDNFASTAVPYLALTILPHKIDSSTFGDRAECVIYSAGRTPIQTNTYTLTANSSSKYGDIFGETYDYVFGTELSRSTAQHHLSGLVQSTKEWHSIAGHGESGGVYTTSYVYDKLGRVETVTAPSGGITQYTYDIRDRLTSIMEGTSLSGGGNLVTTQAFYYDSDGTTTSGVGNGNLTLVRAYVESDASYRDTKYSYDYRDRLIMVENPAPPHAFLEYDHMGRVTKTALFSSVPSAINDPLTDRGAYTETKYSQRGLVYEQKVKIDPTASSGDFLGTYVWYDAAERPIAQWGPNAPATKMTYDGLGRVKTVYVTDRAGDALPGQSDNYDDASSVADDVVFEQTTNSYIEADGSYKGLNDLITHRMRTHDAPDTSTGDLAGFSGSDADLVITTYSGLYYDTANRVIRTVEYGTRVSTGFEYGGVAPTITQGSIPDCDDNISEIVQEISYDIRGLPEVVKQNVGTAGSPIVQQNKVLYDDMDRVIALIENYKNAELDSTTPWDSTNKLWNFTGISSSYQDEDRVTSMVYLITEHKLKQVTYAFDSGGSPDNQITTYEFEATKGTGDEDSRIASYDLLTKVVLPPQYTTPQVQPEADRTITMAYNRLGEVRFSKDQNATKHAYTLDSLGRLTVDKVTAFGSGIDDVIDAITVAYDGFGRTDLVRSYDGYGTSNTIKNAVKFEYTNLWQVENVWQQHDGDVAVSGGSPSLKAAYTYSTAAPASGSAGSNFSRVTKLTYPNGYELPYAYGTSGDSGERISRVKKLDVHGGSDGAVTYEFIGLGLTALIDLAGPDGSLDVMLTRFHTPGITPVQGKYPGLDQFGRVARHIWADGDFASITSTPRIVDIVNTYNKASSKTLVENKNAVFEAWMIRDSQASYDELQRLVAHARGQNSGGGFSHVGSTNASITPGLAWSLDFLGNWTKLVTDLDADGPSESDSADNKEQRRHNDVNEITEIDLAGDNTYELPLSYDKAGNIRERGLTSTTIYRYTHDAWNRLVKVQHVTNPGGGETVVDVHESQYNGLDWRIVKRADTTVPINGLDQERRMYYSGGGERLLEERIDEDYSGSPGINRHMAYIWGLRGRYIDDIVCRLVDGNLDGDYLDYAAGNDKIYYHLTDDEFSTVCIVDHTAKVLERVSYDAYGNPRHHRRSDLNGEGSTNIDDALVVINNWSAPGGRGDVTRDGTVDIDDYLAVINDYGGAVPRGRLNHLSTGFDTDNILGANGMMYNQELSGTPGGGGVNGGAAGGGGGTYSGRGGGNFDSTTGRSGSRAGNPRGAMAAAAGLNGMIGDMGLGSMGISPGTGMCPKSNDSENSPIGDGGPRGRPGPGGDGGEGGGPGPGPGVGPGGGRGPRGGGRTPGWAWGAHDIDPETGKLIAPMEPMPTVRSPGDPGYDEIFALNASWGPARFSGRSWWSYGHEVLDGLGLIPVIGEIADVANGIWYAVEGEWGYAGISFIAVVPVVGDAGKAAKYGHKGYKRYTKLAGKSPHNHHIEPKYLGGPKNGTTVPLDPEYHQNITNAFRNARPYGRGPVSAEERLRIMKEVYKQFPIPGWP
jgi:YD repeat-containing protein